MKRAMLIAKVRLLNDLNSVLPLANYQAISKTENGIEALRMAQRVEPDLIVCGSNSIESIFNSGSTGVGVLTCKLLNTFAPNIDAKATRRIKPP